MIPIGFVRQNLSRIIVILSLPALASCGNLGGPSEPEDMRGAVIETDVITQDMLAPEAFSITDTALWDGRPTFGGVWIAYPGVETPERVRITNPENDESVIGALYKREDGFPGPQIELSADAAAALGIIAGTPTELRVVAMRRVETEINPNAVLGDQPMTTPIRRPGSVTASVPTNAAVIPAIELPTETPAVNSATTAAEAPAAAPEAAAAGQETPTVQATTLPPVDATAPAEAAPTATDETASPPQANANFTFIQVAVQRNLRRAQDDKRKLETAGLDVEIRETKSGSRTLYRIVVGPASSPEAAEIMLNTVRELGYTDAVPLR